MEISRIFSQSSFNLTKSRLFDFPITKVEQIAQVIGSRDKIIIQNKQLLVDIRNYDFNFSYQLYKPAKIDNFSQQTQKQLIMSQIDRLLDQSSFLSKKREQLKVKSKNQNQNNKLSKLNLLPNTDNFNFEQLKNILNSTLTKNSNNEQKIDQLNSVVTKINQKVKSQIASQKLYLKCNKTNEKNLQIVPIRQYQKLKYLLKQKKQQNKELRMQNRALKQALQAQYQYIEQLKALNIQIDSKYKKIEELNKQLQQQNRHLKISTVKQKNEINYINYNQHIIISIYSQQGNYLPSNIQQTTKNKDDLVKFLQLKQLEVYANIRERLQLFQPIFRLEDIQNMSYNSNNYIKKQNNKMDNLIHHVQEFNIKKYKSHNNIAYKQNECLQISFGSNPRIQGQSIENIQCKSPRFTRKRQNITMGHSTQRYKSKSPSFKSY